IIGLSFIMKSPPADWVPVGGEPPKSKKPEQTEIEKPDEIQNEFTPREMMGTLQFWSLWIMYAFSASAGLIIIGHVAVIAKNQAGLETGFLFVALLAVGNAVGRVVTGIV